MGKIYDLLRELKIKENQEYENNIYSVYIGFDDFISFLEDYCKETRTTISNYLLSIDSFLKLNVYYNKKLYTYNFQDYTQYSYDGDNLTYPDDEPIDDFAYVTESYLSDELDMDSSYLFWKIDDILSIKEITNLGIDREVFNNYSYYVDNDTYQKILQENKFLSKRIELLRQGSLDTEIKQMMLEIQSLTKELEFTKNENTQLEKQLKNLGAGKNNEKLHPRTANNASKIILAMAELLKWNLSKPYAKETNGKIVEILERHSNKLSKDIVADWLKQAYDIGK